MGDTGRFTGRATAGEATGPTKPLLPPPLLLPLPPVFSSLAPRRRRPLRWTGARAARAAGACRSRPAARLRHATCAVWLGLCGRRLRAGFLARSSRACTVAHSCSLIYLAWRPAPRAPHTDHTVPRHVLSPLPCSRLYRHLTRQLNAASEHYCVSRSPMPRWTQHTHDDTLSNHERAHMSDIRVAVWCVPPQTLFGSPPGTARPRVRRVKWCAPAPALRHDT